MRDRLRASGATTTITTTISTGTTTGTPEVCCSTTSKAQTRTPHRLAPSLRPSLQASTIVRVRLVPNLSELLSSEHFLSLSLSTHTFSPYFDTIFFFQLFRWAVFITFLIQFHRMARTVSKRNKKMDMFLTCKMGQGGLSFCFLFVRFLSFGFPSWFHTFTEPTTKQKWRTLKAADVMDRRQRVQRLNRIGFHLSMRNTAAAPCPRCPPHRPVPPLFRHYLGTMPNSN